MASQPKLFDLPPKPRKKRQWIMQVSDAGDSGCKYPAGMTEFVEYTCPRCNHNDGWRYMQNVTLAKRGVPCPKCNK
jgi:DNA-directed RNA polymerase subunit RPC12/RpoP